MLEGFETQSQNNPYQVLARRTRPQSFAELVGQEVVSKALESMLESKRIPHAFLFTGTRGTGKTSSARILAKSLCCANGPTLAPCQTCVHCVQITACAHEDVLEIDGASNTGVDNIRELRESARFYPNSSRYKIFIIDEVHMLSIGAFNALLKTLEEPPPQVIFILATTELHKVPITVRSRCMIFPFRKIESEKIAEHLKTLLGREGIGFDDDAMTLVAREARGSLRDALSLLEQVIALCGGKFIDTEQTHAALNVMGESLAANLFTGITQRQAATCLEVLRTADAGSLDLATLLDTTASMFRHALIIKEVPETHKALRLTQLLPREYEHLKLQSAGLSAAALSEVFRALSQAAKEIGRSTAGLAWAEVAALDCVARAEWLSAGELLGQIAGGASGTGNMAGFSSFGSPQAQPAQQPLNIATASSNTNSNANTGAAASKPIAASSSASGSASLPATSTAATNSAVTSESAPSRDGVHGNVDMAAFARVIALLEKKSIGLAAKLKHASLDHFSPRLIQFANIAQNKVYTQLTENDARLFLEALRECGCGQAELKGIDLPRGVLGMNGQPLGQSQQPAGSPGTLQNPSAGPQQSSPSLSPQSHSPHSQPTQSQSSHSPASAPPGATGSAFLDRFQHQGQGVFGSDTPKTKSPPLGSAPLPASAEPIPEKKNTPLTDGGASVSLASIEKESKRQQFLAKAEAVRNTEPVRKLLELATSLEFLPYEGDEALEQ